MIIASIDIGTNTVLLLISRVNPDTKTIVPILNEYRMPRIGKGLIPGSSIAQDRIEKLFAVLVEYESIIKKHNAEKTIIIATNAFRIASNSTTIVKEFGKRFSWDINIISGEVEARLAFLGASGILNNFSNNLVIDIGGGSTELICGSNSKIFYRKSFPLGSVYTTEMFFKHFPVNPAEINKLNDHISKEFCEIKKMVAPELTIAIAGTATTLFCMIKHLKEFDEKKVEGSILTFNELKQFSLKLSELIPEEIKSKYGNVTRGREDIILAGSIILLNLMRLLELSEVMVSSRGIRYGVIYHYLQDQTDFNIS